MANDKNTQTTTDDKGRSSTDPKFSDHDAPMTGGITSKHEDNIPHNVFNTEGNQPVRDKVADESKGTPVTRYFTKDGTPVEPSTVPPAATPSNLQGFDASKRDDIVAVVEYVDEAGSTVTHDMLESNKEKGDNHGQESKA